MKGIKIIAAVMALAILPSILPITVTAEGDKTANITIQYRDEAQMITMLTQRSKAL